MKKISIIIPNYNNAQWIERCLDSVRRQNYPNLEIIVVDDGSEDDSISKVENFMKSNSGLNVKLLCQSNQNAAIARNKGLSIATGHYVLFLDSDDVLEDNILSKMAVAYEQNNVDLVIGNFSTINLSGGANYTKNDMTISEDRILDVRPNYNNLINMSPVPSNKLYNLRLIKDNSLEWGNVRIGQDLNFYLKYLLHCERIALIKDVIYQHRLSKKSVSKAYDLRIFDIVNSFTDVKKYYVRNGENALFEKYLPTLELRHFSYQISKAIYFANRQDRSLIVKYFYVAEKKIDYSHCIVKNRKLHVLFRLKCILRPLYISKTYYIFKKKHNGIIK